MAARAGRAHWPDGLRPYVASLYAMKVEDRGRVADFLESAGRCHQPAA